MYKILLTGSCGYIGSHTWLALLAAGYKVVGIDNFINSTPAVLPRLQHLSGQKLEFEKINVCNQSEVAGVFSRNKIDCVVHLAAVKAVGESTVNPLLYYSNNINGLLGIAQAMLQSNCYNFVFSSSATVYGIPQELPVTENAVLNPSHPYGQTKLMGETILRDLHLANPEWCNVVLRYFNPVGADESGLIGEDPRGVPNNLMPYVAQVAVGRRDVLDIFGKDYNTHDGTGVRDYLHVSDLAQGHVAAVDWLLNNRQCLTANLGTGNGSSVLDVVNAYALASSRDIKYRFVDRRPGDIDAYWADPSLAKTTLNWSATRNLQQMCEDSWRWQSMNPNGYEL